MTDLNIENIPPYDKNSSIYKLYTKEEFQIETNYFKSITPAIIGGETNAQSFEVGISTTCIKSENPYAILKTLSTTTIYITLANIGIENGMKSFKGFL